MNRTRIMMVFVVMLTGVNIGLLWEGGQNLAADPERDASFGTESLRRREVQSSPTTVDGAVPIRPADPLLGQLSAAGTIELVSQREIVLEVAGTVSQVAAAVGDKVSAGTLLLTLDDTDLKRAVGKAEAELRSLNAELSKLYEESSAAEIAAAQAGLHSAQEKLALVQSGATAEELAAAESKLNAASAKYAELQSGPGGAEIEEAKAELEKAEIDRQEAQRAYDKVAWRNDIGMTPEAARLHKATVEYEKSLAKFERVNKPTSQSELQSALSEIRTAQHKLDTLRNRPNLSEVAEAEAKVAEAEQQLAKLTAGPSSAAVQDVESRIQKAKLELEAAQVQVTQAEIRSPISGTVLELKLEAGQRGTVGTAVAIVADTNQLQLTVEAAEIDVPQIQIGQKANIRLDALRDQTFSGIVEQIAPISQSGEQDVVNYPVTIRLTGPSLEGVKPGMNAVATIQKEEAPQKRWLVPQNALKRKDNGTQSVTVQRGEEFLTVEVVPGETVGEWIAVESPELHAGDAVLGRLASYVDQDNQLQVDQY